MDELFDLAIARAAALRLTETELAEEAGMAYTRWWRAKAGRCKRVSTRVHVLRQVEKILDALEAQRAPVEPGGIALPAQAGEGKAPPACFSGD